MERFLGNKCISISNEYDERNSKSSGRQAGEPSSFSTDMVGGTQGGRVVEGYRSYSSLHQEQSPEEKIASNECQERISVMCIDLCSSQQGNGWSGAPRERSRPRKARSSRPRFILVEWLVGWNA